MQKVESLFLSHFFLKCCFFPYGSPEKERTKDIISRVSRYDNLEDTRSWDVEETGRVEDTRQGERVGDGKEEETE